MSEIEKVDLSALDHKIVDLSATYSPDEIAEKLGMPGRGAEIASRAQRIYSSNDWLTVKQREMRNIIQLERIYDEIIERASNMDDEWYAPTIKAALQALQGVGQRLDARRKDTQEDITQIKQAHARAFGNAFDLALDHLIDWIESEYPEVDSTLLNRAVREGLKLAAESLQEQVSDDGLS